MMRFRLASLFVPLLVACSGSDDTGEGTLDLTRDVAAPPEGGLQIMTPDLSVPPESGIIWCYYGTYTGDTVGVDFLQPFASAYNHHVFIQGAQENSREDGTLEECTDVAGMDQSSPLFEFTGTSLTSDGNYLPLPDGTALQFLSGQPWVIEAHFINPTARELLVNAAFNLGFTPADQVERWAGSWQFDIGDLAIPAGERTSREFDCKFGQDVELLSLSGHMHENGEAVLVDWIHEGGEENLYAETDWEPEYRDHPPLRTWEPGEMLIDALDSLRTTCTWNNTTGSTLSFPGEMCTAKGLALDIQAPLFCVDGQHQ